MLVAMPLHGLQYFEKEDFFFSDSRFSIRAFEMADFQCEREIFSERDREYMRDATKALFVSGDGICNYENDANLLLAAFRIASDDVTFNIRYRLSAETELNSRLEGVETQLYIQGYMHQAYSLAEFQTVDAYFLRMMNAPQVTRIKNAFFFLYKAFYAGHWVDAFLFYVNTLEALFSKDVGGAATTTICTRVSNLLRNSSTWPEATIRELYDVRSKITHGYIEANSDSMENIKLTHTAATVVKLCFRRLLDGQYMCNYATKQLRDSFMGTLD